MKLSIVILSYNTKDLTVRCIQSLIKQYKKQFEEREFEIIVVDNNSTDKSVESIKSSEDIKNIKGFQLITNDQNFGFSKGNNIGARKAKGKYILFLNSDTKIKDMGFIGMIEYLKSHPKVGVLGAKMISEEGISQPSAGRFYTLIVTLFMLFGGNRFKLLWNSPTKNTVVDWVSGASMMVRKELFDKLKGFDEHIFMYVEDMEFCYRVKNKGYEILFYSDIHIVHKELGSSNKEFAILSIYKGLLYFCKKHKGNWQYNFVRLLLIVKAMLAFCAGFISQNKELMQTYKKALRVAWA